VTDSDLAALKKSMVDAHPDHGGTAEAFITARKAYLAAKWRREEAEAAAAVTAEAERRQREAAAAAEEERRQREATEAMARFRRQAAKAICAYAAVILVFALVGLYKKDSVTAARGRHVDLAATSTAPRPQFQPSKPYKAVSDSPKPSIKNASADEPRPVATVAVRSDSMREDAMIESVAAEPSTPERQVEAPLQTVAPVAPEVGPPPSPVPLKPERQAEFIVYHLTAVENGGNVDDLSAYYSDTINYYGKPTAKSAVVADKTRFIRRWPIRRYTIRPESLAVACDIVKCTADGMIDFDVSNAGRRSTGTASFTYHLQMRHNNSEPPDLLVTAENSVVVRRTVTDIGQSPGTAPQGRE
jgi:hypothetical protein